jgi:putative ABC transport system substrate-binding protein
MKLRLARAVVLSITLIAAALHATAQPSGAMYRVGYLSPGPGYPFEAFREGLQELGYVEGRNIVIERRSAQGDPQRLPQLAADLVRLRVDVIVTATTAATQAAQRATTTIPIVFALADNPVGLGLVAGVARPGGNITGLTGLIVELTAKRLELIKEVLPRVTRVAVLSSPYPFSPAALKEAEEAGRRLGLQLDTVEVLQPAELDAAFARMTARKAQAVLLLPHPMFVAQRKRIAELAARYRLPAIYHLKEFVEVGGLMSYAPDVAHMSRQAAVYVDRILKGAKPGDLPVEQPTKFELVVNVKTAKALGITIPESMLLRADEVIK